MKPFAFCLALVFPLLFLAFWAILHLVTLIFPALP